MLTYRKCRHCGADVPYRVGRGLCRPCWDDKAIRERYGPVATFGGNTHVQIRVAREYTESEDGRRQPDPSPEARDERQ